MAKPQKGPDHPQVPEPTKAAAEEIKRELQENPFYGLRSLMENAESSWRLSRKMTQWAHYSTALSVVLLGVAIAGWKKASEQEHRYFFINSEGHVYETNALKMPIITQEVVKNFASEVAMGLHTFTYRNYLEQFRRMRDYCEDSVVAAIYKKNMDTGLFTTLQEYEQRYESLTTSMNVVQESEDSKGRKAWRLHGTVNEHIHGTGGRPIRQDFKITIDVKQVPLSENPRGLKCVRVDENYG